MAAGLTHTATMAGVKLIGPKKTRALLSALNGMHSSRAARSPDSGLQGEGGGGTGQEEGGGGGGGGGSRIPKIEGVDALDVVLKWVGGEQ